MPRMVTCRDWNGGKHKIPVEEMYCRPSVYGILIRDKNILLSPQRDGFDLPGGGVELHETIEHALIREFKEETGLTVSMGEIVHAERDFYYALNKKEAYSTILMYYTCQYSGGEINDAGFDEYEKEYARKAEWIPLSKIEKIRFHNPVDSIAVIRKAMKI